MTLEDIYRERCSVWSDIVDHLPFIHDFVLGQDAKVIVELGVRSGNSTAAFLAAVERTDGHVWSVDIGRPQVPAEFEQSGRWTFILGDDLTVERSLPDDIDVLFIDSSHLYEHTLNELRLYGPSSKRILLHDTELEHPDGAPDCPAFPVKKAVEEWCEEMGRQWHNFPHCYGLGVVSD